MSKLTKRIALIGDPVRVDDRVGHHDYHASCKLVADLLGRIAGIEPIVIEHGWPQDEKILSGCAGLVFFAGGGGKQGFLRTPGRTHWFAKAVDAGIGLTVIHKAVAFPVEAAAQSLAWLGGSYVPGVSHRGHWSSSHVDQGDHPISSALEPWDASDGWLNNIQFDKASRQNISPLLWSGKRHKGSPRGGDEDIVSWAFERPGGGRTFCFTGLDAHSAWQVAQLRRFLLNGILWSVHQELPTSGVWCEMDSATINSYLSPRQPVKGILKKFWKVAGKALRLRQRW